ncbi:MAG: excinuclease ABC subunit UvrB [Ruminococcus sp.]|nr:excinuclease ABC subunit UvrB [Ruminococcus sp.]MDE6847734.1 excinuclease ABC subunit UvrB [Ruminococcus sp.]
MNHFRLHSKYAPAGDQPQAIDKLVKGIELGTKEQILLGVTGSGKTFTMANVIARVNKPTLVLAHNKILAAQLCSEFREFFPENAVEYFVSYYDYYQPEAYVPSTDSYIEKDSSINDEIDKLRHSATTALAERRDVIIVASVSCIYSLGSPEEYRSMVVSIRQGTEKPRDQLISELVKIRYERNDIAFERNKFRVRGDVVEIFPARSSDTAIRVEYFGDEIDRISEINAVTGEVKAVVSHVAIFPASHYVVGDEKIESALEEIDHELAERIDYFTENNKLIEAQRIEQRTHYDMEMLREVGYCSGVENYSRVLSGRPVGSTPQTLLDHFPEDFLLIVDESHVTLPQVRAMYAGDRARKTTLVDYGFRLPSAFDNRPLNFDEFNAHINQAVYVSATPGKIEREKTDIIVEQVIRPTGLVDPEIIVKSTVGQIDDLFSEINIRAEKNERVLITTLTKKMAEDLTDYYECMGVKVRYMHHDIDTIERMEIIRDLRNGVFDVLVGINLLREGLDIPEVSLVAVLDADKEGFLRSETSLIQTIGRAARNSHGKVIMYADTVTGSMERAIIETERRRSLQIAYNEEHGIIPETIIKEVHDVLEITSKNKVEEKSSKKKLSAKDRKELIEKLTVEMKNAAKMLEFEHAAYLRDKIKELKGEK